MQRSPELDVNDSVVAGGTGGLAEPIALEHRDSARAAFERALHEASGVVGPGAVELLNVRVNLGFTTDDPESRDQILAEAEAEKARVLGADHPETLDTRWLRARRMSRFVAAAEILDSACAGLEAHDGANAMWCWSELGYLKSETANLSGAAAAMQRALSVQIDGPERLPYSPYLHLWQGDTAAAAREFAAGIKAILAVNDPPWWDRYVHANLELGLAIARREKGQLREAKQLLTQSVERLQEIATKHSDGGVDRRLGRARAELAEVLSAMHAPPSEVAPYAAPAVEWLRQAGGSSGEISELDRLAGQSAP